MALGAGVATLAVMLFLSANYLSGTHHKAWDLSRNNQFTLSNQTRKLLKSSLLKDRNNPVHLIAVVRKSSTHHVRLLAMLDEYQRLAGGKLTVEFVDPIRDADAALEIADQYETTFVEDVVIINAIPPLPPAPENGAEAAEHAEKIKALRKSHIQYVTVEDMLERDPHLAARGYFETIPHLVKGTVVATGIPLGLTQPPGKTTRAGAGIGCDNDFVFGELLGLSPAELLAHRESGAIETP